MKTDLLVSVSQIKLKRLKRLKVPDYEEFTLPMCSNNNMGF